MNDKRMMIGTFISEIKHQCEFVFISLNLIQQGLEEKQQAMIWFSLHAFFGATGNLSKIFWPIMTAEEQTNKAVKEQFLFRAKTLRKLFDITDDSPLNKKKFRNHFEYFDSRIQQWAMECARHTLSDRTIGLSGRISGIDEIDSLRNFDPTNQTLTFTGEELQLRPLIKVVEAINEKSKILDLRSWWELEF